MLTESRGRVVNTPASYSGGPAFKSRFEDRLTDVIRGFTQSFHTNAGVVP
jgi:hypothetical protein